MGRFIAKLGVCETCEHVCQIAFGFCGDCNSRMKVSGITPDQMIWPLALPLLASELQAEADKVLFVFLKKQGAPVFVIKQLLRQWPQDQTFKNLGVSNSMAWKKLQFMALKEPEKLASALRPQLSFFKSARRNNHMWKRIVAIEMANNHYSERHILSWNSFVRSVESLPWSELPSSFSANESKLKQVRLLYFRDVSAFRKLLPRIINNHKVKTIAHSKETKARSENWGPDPLVVGAWSNYNKWG